MDLLKNFSKVCLNFRKVSAIRKSLKNLPKDMFEEITKNLQQNVPGEIFSPLKEPHFLFKMGFLPGKRCTAVLNDIERIKMKIPIGQKKKNGSFGKEFL